MYLGRGPSPFGNGPRRSETSTEPPHREHRRAYREKSEDNRMGGCALARTKTTMIAEKGRRPDGNQIYARRPIASRLQRPLGFVKGRRAGKVSFSYPKTPDRKYFCCHPVKWQLEDNLIYIHRSMYRVAARKNPPWLKFWP